MSWICCGVFNHGNNCRICGEAREGDIEDTLPLPKKKQSIFKKDPKRIYFKGGFSMLKKARPITPYKTK